jgi:hypothetical protein
VARDVQLALCVGAIRHGNCSFELRKERLLQRQVSVEKTLTDFSGIHPACAYPRQQVELRFDDRV